MATIHTFRPRFATRPQALIEPPVDTRTPLIKKLDDLIERAKAPAVREAREPMMLTDPTFWRRGYNEFLREGRNLPEARCLRCQGRGWIPAHKYADWDDYIDCPQCSEPAEYVDEEPF